MKTDTRLQLLARETVLRWKGKLSDPETFEYLYENVLAALQTAVGEINGELLDAAMVLVETLPKAVLKEPIQSARAIIINLSKNRKPREVLWRKANEIPSAIGRQN